MPSENSLVTIDIYYITYKGFKYNLASFVTKLTNALKIVFESFNKQNIFFIEVEKFLPTLPIPIIFPCLLSSNVTSPPSFGMSEVN